ncbi:MAG: hypothetical protein E7559_01730 [Ruminococcaceae bacterium]|nr:hypothetical protein [Oscillospiraceae bacterium]
MLYYVNASAPYGGDGCKQRPFRRINDAARIALPGDEIIVAPGIYREYVNPKNAGREDARIVYRSEVPLAAVITGAEQVKNWEQHEGNVWVARIPNGIFGSYNPYTTVVRGDWYFSMVPRHTGEVYLNGRSLYETDSLEGVLNPQPHELSWEAPELTLYTWYTCQEEDNTLIYCNFQGADPNAEDVEINVRRNCFYPQEEGIGYITLSGFTVKQAATTWAPPTAYQDGMVGPHWSRGWIIEDCDISHSKCSGISLGKYLQPNNENKWTTRFTKDGTQTERDAICQAQREGWVKEKVGSHIIRRCHIHHCEQTGIVGHLGGVFSIIEDNHIHNINNKQQLGGAEIGGIKMHAAIDVVIQRNHFHHCTRGLWLDWQAQGTRVTRNLFHDNVTPAHVKGAHGLAVGEDVFVEVSHGPTLLDNNLFLSVFAGRLSTQGVAYVHNLIAGSFTFVGRATQNDQTGQPRYTPYHVPHRTEINGFMSILHGDDRFYNNIFVQQDVPEHLKNLQLGPETEELIETVAGTHTFNDYPTEEEWRFLFFGKEGDTFRERIGRIIENDAYFHRLPVWTGGNVFFGGAKPCVKEKNFGDVAKKVKLELVERDGGYYLDTDLFELMPEVSAGIISTETLGEAFEPEQLFENPDGTPITFDTDYFGGHRVGVLPVAGPFADAECAKGKLY